MIRFTRPLDLVRRGAVFAALWLGLTGADPDGFWAGLLVVPAVVWLSRQLLPPGRGLRWGRVLALLPRFLWQSLVGGVDVARRAFDPRLPLRPGWRRVPVSLPDGARVALGAELSLMPGTLVAGAEGDALLVHLLDRDQDVDRAVAREAALLARLQED